MRGKWSRTAVYEVLAVARAAGIHPPGLEDPKVALAGALKIATQMAEALSPTGQDLNRGKRTEIDLAELATSRAVGRELGVPTPVNHALYASSGWPKAVRSSATLLPARGEASSY